MGRGLAIGVVSARYGSAAIMSGWDPSLFGLMWGVNGVPTGFFREGRGGIQVCMVHWQSLLSASLGHEFISKGCNVRVPQVSLTFEHSTLNSSNSSKSLC